MRAVLAVSFFAALSLPACALSRSVIASGDVEASRDDASVPDDGRLDAPDLDAPSPPDAPDTGPVCVVTSPTELACDRVDDDCDGTVDDDDVCGCVAITALGQAYLSCPGPVSGMEAWAGSCRRAAPGYDLAAFASEAQQSAVLSALSGLTLTDPHWIGLNDFEENGTYVWRDRSTTFTPAMIGGDDPAKRFVILRIDGSYDELTSTDAHRVLCEAVLAPGACRASSEPAGCDGVDDDCDGVADGGVDCGGRACTASTFWDRVYYVCAQGQTQAQAAADCATDMGAMLASFDHATEHERLAQRCPMEAWIGLTQDVGSSAPDTGWRWSDGSTRYGVPVSLGVRPWDPGEPNDAGSVVEADLENCGLLLAPARASNLDDRGCDASLPFVCERAWSY